MLEREVMVSVRALALTVEPQGGPAALSNEAFGALDLADVLASAGHDPGHCLAVLALMEAEGLVDVRERAGQGGAQETAFVLTRKGYEAGLPERYGGGAAGWSVARRALLFAGCVLGLVGGPLALAGLLDPLIHWDGRVLRLLAIWWENVTGPLERVLREGLAAIGVFDVSPHTLESAIEYVLLGVLVDAALRNAWRAQREATSFVEGLAPTPPLRRAVRFIVTFVVQVALWPLFLAWELVHTAVAAFIYARKRDELDPGLLYLMPPQALKVRFVTLVVPLLVFVGMFVADQLT